MADGVRRWAIQYRAHNQTRRPAYVVLPAEYGPQRPPPPLPLVIAPHGRGVSPETNARMWANLPALGGFAVVCPGGMGRVLKLKSWGYRGQIADLARMRQIVTNHLPWLRLSTKTYAIGGSMGGQESLLLLGQYPQLLDGVVAIDSVTNFYRRYHDFGRNVRTIGLQAAAQAEVGGTPRTNPVGYVLRSPTHWIGQVARSGVPLQMWWSIADEVVIDQIHQSAKFFRDLRRLGPRGRLESVTGFWGHSEAFSEIQLPGALRWLGLLRA
jgi:pimeloyl-ACP methyl ester carboxylesterase